MQENFGIGERLRIAREHKGLNKSKLGAKVGTSGTSINNIEKGETSSPNAMLLERIASELQVNLRWLLTGEGSMLSEPKATQHAQAGRDIGTQAGRDVHHSNNNSDCEQKLAAALREIELLKERIKDKEQMIELLLRR
jgi:transcriptional regulator with XRE-family HTH domain